LALLSGLPLALIDTFSDFVNCETPDPENARIRPNKEEWRG
jgi:hypothetical protein